MKFLKEYKDIDWDDIDIEEEDPNKIPTDFIGYEEFYYFLKNKGLYDKFIYNHKLYPVFDVSLRKYFDSKDISTFLSSAFYWRTTKEGVNFWRNLNYEWYELKTGKEY